MQTFEYKLSLDGEIVCRTPAFSMDDELESKLDELKTMIMEASPSFYQVISSLKKEDLNKQSDKIKYTLWKYFNRAKYRATPFGKFSAVSMIPYRQDSPIVLADNLKLNYYPDWQATGAQESDAVTALKESSEFIINSFLYKVGNEYRYLFSENGRFEIAFVPNFPELDFMAAYCSVKRQKEAIYHRLSERLNLNDSSVTDLLTQLISAQILIPDCTPNITGDDFFLRKPIKVQVKESISYVIAGRKLISGAYHSQISKTIPELVNFLNTHLPETINNNFQSFINTFKKKFELRFVPLGLAIDPEIGVGYANLENSKQNTSITDLADRFKRRTTEQPKNINYHPLLIFLLNKSMQGDIIHLEEFNDKINTPPATLPNTFSVILHHWNSFGVVEHIGGATANSLIGRFTIGIPEIENMGRRLAAIEQAANPDILFFDIAYQAERHIDNVNRRKSLYDCELPILTWSCLDEPLNLGDIMVGVHHDEVLLFSKKYQKRMVPRIPSAYNYHRSDLPLFRFLCDLQHQKIRTKLSFRLSELLPGLDHYSRVVFRNLIVSPETWRLPEYVVDELITSKQDAIFIIKRWLGKIELCVPFTVGKGDQTLVISPLKEDDLSKLAIYCRKNADQPIYLSEACVPDAPAVANESGNPLAAQFIFNYFHRQRVYVPVTESIRGVKYEYGNYVIPPGNDWLYFAIYSHPSRFDDLLENQIAPYLHTYRKDIVKWFFVRYDDNGPHLRLRILMKDNKQTFILMEALQHLLESSIRTGIITDLQIKSYFPEITRYGKERLSEIEELFYHDSRYVITLIKKHYDHEIFYNIALATLHRLIAAGFTTPTERLDFLSFMASAYSREFAMNQDDFKQMNKQPNALKDDLLKVTKYAMPACLPKLEKVFAQLIQQARHVNDKYTLAADILHMHINRLFAFDQRAHEAIMYQQLFKHLKTQEFLVIKQAIAVLP